MPSSYEKAKLILEFPSPCGEKVGINKVIAGQAKTLKLTDEFPSPCGEKVGINRLH